MYVVSKVEDGNAFAISGSKTGWLGTENGIATGYTSDLKKASRFLDYMGAYSFVSRNGFRRTHQIVPLMDVVSRLGILDD